VFGASSCEKNLGVVLVSEVDSAELFGPLVLLQNQYLLTTAVISILRPLQSLRKTMGHVQTGRFEKVDIERRDEIGELATSFNTMVEEIGIKTKKLHLKNDILSFMSSRLQVQADELIKADREKEEFSEVISHELKTFLVPIIGYSELLLDGTFDELTAAQKRQLQVVLEKAWSLLYLTQNIIDARQLEYGVLKMKMSEQVSARKLVEECVGRSLPIAKSRELDIVSEAEDVYVACDQQRILQVLDNLVNNAIKATKDAGKNRMVKVSAKKHNEHLLFSVSDNGIGISEEKQRELFKKFYQIDKSLTRQTGGSGLGLTISKGIVESHAGKIWFESKPGAGSTFYFSVPISGQNPVGGR
jgi:signal transduction histidine kinase